MTKEEKKKYGKMSMPNTIVEYVQQNEHLQTEAFMIAILDQVLFYQKQLEDIKVKEGGAGMVGSAHEFIEDMMKTIPADIKQQISCRRGCAHCCHIKVDVSLNEARLLLERALQDKIPLSRKRMEAQAGKDIEQRMDMKGDKRCVFLGDDNECRVYDIRPVACRNHVVTSPPALCNTYTNRYGKTNVYFNMHCELMSGALMNTEPGGEMNEILLQQIKSLPNGKHVSRVTWLQEDDGSNELRATTPAETKAQGAAPGHS